MANENISRSERLEKGQVEAQAIIEVVGKPKEHVEKAIKDYIEKLRQDKNYEITEEFIDETAERENFFSTYADIKFWAKDMKLLIGFCFDYMPSSIEILDPEKKIVEMKLITDMLNDMQARLYHADMMSRKMLEGQMEFGKTFNALVRNIVMITLMKRKFDIDGLEKITGVKKDVLKNILDKMVEENKIMLENGEYSRGNDGTGKD